MPCQRSIVLVPHSFPIEALSPFEPQSSPFERATHRDARLADVVLVIVHLALLVIQELVHLDLITTEARIHPFAQIKDGTFRDPIGGKYPHWSRAPSGTRLVLNAVPLFL